MISYKIRGKNSIFLHKFGSGTIMHNIEIVHYYDIISETYML